MDIKEIIKEYLEQHGYEGLCCPETGCGCEINDLFPFANGIVNYCSSLECIPGYLHSDGLIYAEKEETND
jgi:hypothetical protein